MFDLRARIGLMVPSLNTAIEPESWKMAPEGVAFYGARMRIEETTESGLLKMAGYAKGAAKDLGDTDCDAIIFGCTSGSFVKGLAWERALVRQLEDVSGTKVISTSGALLQALEAFKIKRISIATPYIEEIDLLAKRFFTECGFDVQQVRGLGRYRKGEIRAVSYQEVYRLGKSVVTPETELLILSCTEMRSARIIAQMEADFGIPVVSSNQASVWAALRHCGIHDTNPQYGSLFSR